jgi:hypothetical protein
VDLRRRDGFGGFGAHVVIPAHAGVARQSPQGNLAPYVERAVVPPASLKMRPAPPA